MSHGEALASGQWPPRGLLSLSMGWMVMVSLMVWKPWGFNGILPPKELAFVIGAFLISTYAYAGRTDSGGLWRYLPLAALSTLLMTGLRPVACKQVLNIYLASLVLLAWRRWATLQFYRWLFLTFLGGTLVHLSYCWLQMVYDPIFHPVDLFLRQGYVPQTRDHMFGFMGAPAHLACLLAVSYPILWLLPRSGKNLLRICIILTLLKIGTLAALLAVALVELYNLPTMWRLRVGLVVSGPLLYGIWHKDWGMRLPVWQQTWQWIQQHPIHGWGFGRFGVDMVMMTGQSPYLEKWVHPHNEYLAILLVGGLLGGLCLSVILFWAMIHLSMVRPQGLAIRRPPLVTSAFLMGIVLLVLGLTQQAWHVAPVILAGLVAAGCLMEASRESFARVDRARTIVEHRLQGVSYAV